MSSDECGSNEDIEDPITKARLLIEIQKREFDQKEFERLLERLNNVDITDKNNTLLHTAVVKGHTKAIQLLLNKGASFEVKNDEGQTPLMLAEALPDQISCSKNEILSLLESYKTYRAQKDEDCDGCTDEIQFSNTEGKVYEERNAFEAADMSNPPKISWNEEGKTSVGVAVEKGSIEDLELALGGHTSTDSPNLTNQELHLLNEACDEEKNTPLMLCAKIKDHEKLRFLLNKGAEVNERNIYNERAIDHSWKNKDYVCVLELLKWDSYFPDNCTIESIIENDLTAENLRQFLNDRVELHRQIEFGCLEKVKKLIERHKSQVYLSPKNKSARFAAGMMKKWKVYAFLSSTGAKFMTDKEEQECDLTLELEDRHGLRMELRKNVIEVESYIKKLVGKSKVYGRINNAKKIIEGLYVHLDKVEHISRVLQVLQFCSNLEIIFDFNSESTRNMDPDDPVGVKGKTDYVCGKIEIAAKGSDIEGPRRSMVLGTLAHEMTHQAISLLYNNDCNPYSNEDDIKAAMFDEITHESFLEVCRNFVELEIMSTSHYLKDVNDHFITLTKSKAKSKLIRKLKGTEQRKVVLDEIISEINVNFIKRVIERGTTSHLHDIIKMVFIVYEPVYWHLELIVRIPHILAELGEEEGLEMIKEQLPKLLKYYEEHIHGPLKEFLMIEPYVKQAMAILDMNEYLGEIKGIQSERLRIQDPSENVPFYPYMENFFVVKTSSILLCTIYFYQALSLEYKFLFQKYCIFINLSSFQKIDTKVLSVVNLEACKVVVLISDPSSPCDVNNLASRFSKLKAKVYFLVNDNNVIDCQVKNFTWDCLSHSSKDYLLKKRFSCQGRETSLNELTNGKIDHDFLDPPALTMLVEKGDISVSHENELCKEYDEDCYIPRNFRQQTISNYILRKENITTTLFISNATKQDLLSMDASEDDMQPWENGNGNCDKGKRIIFLHNKNINTDGKIFIPTYQKISKQRKIHWLHLQQKQLVWKKSNADLSELTDFIDKDVTIDYKNEIEFFDEKNCTDITILADKSGMGKSTVLTKLAKKLKDQGLWTVRFNLIDYISDLKKIDFGESEVEKAIDFVGTLYSRIPFDKCLFRHCCKQSNKIVIIFDGFNEILPDYRKRLLNLFKALKQSSVAQLWITTRFSEKQFLEKELKILAYTLNHWSREDQIAFLDKFWKKKFKSLEDGKVISKVLEMQKGIRQWVDSFGSENHELVNSISEGILNFDINAYEEQDMKVKRFKKYIMKLDLTSYAKMLLNQLNKTIHDEEGKFTFVPLHNLMLANVVFEYDFKIPKDFNLNNLYDDFVQTKFNIFYQKKKLENFDEIEKPFRDSIQKAHQYEAMKIFLNDEKFLPEIFRHKCGTEDAMVMIGLVTSSKDGFKFIHRTFAEYFFSEGLIENAGDANIQRFWLEKILVDKTFVLVRHFLNSRIEKKNLSIKFNTELIEKKMFFKANRKIGTNFHRLAYEGLNSILEIFFKNFPDKVHEIILSANCYSENILHSACQNNHYKVVKKILDFANDKLRKESIERLILLRDNSGRTPFYLAVENNYTESMEVFFLRTFKCINDKTRKEMLFKTKKRGKTVLHESVLRGYENATKMLCKLSSDVLSDDKLKKFLKKEDSDGGNVLHYAACRANIDILQQLWIFSKRILDESLHKEFLIGSDELGETVLHKAAFRGHVNILKNILTLASEVCVDDSYCEFLIGCDNMKETALHKAAGRGHGEILQYFLNHCNGVSDLPMKEYILKGNISGCTVLHKASYAGSPNVLDVLWTFINAMGTKEFLEDFIFRVNKIEETALHVAACEGQIDFVKEFLYKIKSSLGEKVLQEYLMLSNEEKNTSFHIAALKGHVDICDALYRDAKSTLDNKRLLKFMFICSVSHTSTLHFAALKGNVTMLKFLWDVFKRENNPEFFREFVQLTTDCGDTILHIVSFKGYNWIIKELFKISGSMLNEELLEQFLTKANDCNETFLHRASMKANSNVIAEVRNFRKDILSEEIIRSLLYQADKWEDTVLHKVVQRSYTQLMRDLLNYSKDTLSKKSLKEVVLKKNTFGYTILHIAILKDNAKLLEELKKLYECNALERDVIFEFLLITDKQWGDTALHKSTFKSNIDVFNQLVDFAQQVLGEASVEDFLLKTNSRGYTALHKAAKFSTGDFFIKMCEKSQAVLQKRFVEFLTTPNKYGNTILHTAASRGEECIVKKICDLLKENYPKEFLLQTDSDEDTIFHKASIKGNLSAFLYLADFVKQNVGEAEFIECLCKINRHGNNFLQLAVKDHSEVVQELLDYAEPEMKDKLKSTVMNVNRDGETIIHMSAKSSVCEYFSQICDRVKGTLDMKSFEELLKKPNIKGETVLHTVAFRGEVGILKKLYELLNENVDKGFLLQTDSEGNTVLHKALIHEDVDIFFCLAEFIEQKVKEEDFMKFCAIKNQHGNTFLQIVQQEHSPIILEKKKTIEDKYSYFFT